MRILLVLLMLTGCASFGNVDTKVTWHNGDEINVNSKSDSIVKYTKGDESIEVNNQGAPNILETIVGVSAVKAINE